MVKREKRRLERQKRIAEYSLPPSAMSEAISADPRRARSRAETSSCHRSQLNPANFNKFVTSPSTNISAPTPAAFSVSPNFKSLILLAISRLRRGKAIGVDGIHSEMLQAHPDLCAKFLSKIWSTVGRLQVYSYSYIQEQREQVQSCKLPPGLPPVSYAQSNRNRFRNSDFPRIYAPPDAIWFSSRPKHRLGFTLSGTRNGIWESRRYHGFAKGLRLCREIYSPETLHGSPITKHYQHDSKLTGTSYLTHRWRCNQHLRYLHSRSCAGVPMLFPTLQYFHRPTCGASSCNGCITPRRASQRTSC